MPRVHRLGHREGLWRPAGAAPDSIPAMSGPDLTVLVYSEDHAVRDRLRMAIGRRPAAELGRVDYLEADTGPAVVGAVDAGGVDLCVLDGESWPTGGLGISRQLKNEIADCPAIVVVVGRRDDAWLATWSQADGVLEHPLDPVATRTLVAQLLQRRRDELSTGSSAE